MNEFYEFYYPGIYDETDKKILSDFQAKLDEVNEQGKSIDVDDLINSKHENKYGSRVREINITPEAMKMVADSYVSENPLFTDKEYAGKTWYGDRPVFPLIVEPSFMPAMPPGIGDYMVVSDHNDTINFYKPVFEGDTLYMVTTEQHFKDITPEAGSYYRTFAMSGAGRIYNQKGELVAEGSNILKESFRRRKDPAKRNKGGVRAWESPDWWHQRPPHTYTDEDWEYIINLWKQEKRRGAEALYWDDVNIGNEPVPTVNGPVLAEAEFDILFGLPQWAADTKKNVLNTEIFSKMVKNKQGIYVFPEYLEKKPKGSVQDPFSPIPAGAMQDMPQELANRDGRSVIQNAVATKWAANMLYNWMGDTGWLQRIGWDIMSQPPGYDESVIPPLLERPALFDKFPYLEKVPYMKGKRADCHGMEGDVSINRAYVCDKYEKGGEYFVDLIWWCETLDKYLIEEGFATVKLPKK